MSWFAWLTAWFLSWFFSKPTASAPSCSPPQEQKVLEFPILPIHTLPTTLENQTHFVQSFDIDTDNPQDIVNFYNEYGLVVFRNVIDQETIEKSLTEVWDMLQHDHEMKMHDPYSWQKLSTLGIVGDFICWKKQAMENRQNEKLVRAFELLYGKSRQELWTGFSRIGVMQPTRNVPIPYHDVNSLPACEISHAVQVERHVNRPDLKTKAEWLHWDLNPFCVIEEDKQPEDEKLLLQTLRTNPDYYFILENNANMMVERMQGILHFTEGRDQDGVFVCVPGFHQHAREYAQAMKPQLEPLRKLCTFVSVPQGDKLFEQYQKVPVKAGSLIVFNSMLPHANQPNDSERFRICQYIKMVPRKGSETFQKMRSSIIDMGMDPEFVPSETGKIVFGLDQLDKYK